MANYQQTSVYTGLQTFTIFTAPTTDTYTLGAFLTLPQITQGSSANSSVVATVKNQTQSSTIYTSTADQTGLSTTFQATAGDVIQIQLSSAAAVDQPLNMIKMIVTVFEGAI